MAGGDDFRFNEAAMEELISQLRSIKSQMDDLSANIEKILRNELTANGIVGNTADVLVEAFDRVVVKDTLNYSDVSNTFISLNEQVKVLAGETSQKNQQIADSI